MMSKKITYKGYIFWGIIFLSIIGLFLSPKVEIIDQLKANLPWVATGILLSEIVLTTGFILMLSIATPAFIRGLTKNINSAASGIFHIKQKVAELDWIHVANKCNNSKLFWFGFWLSVAGAAGDGIVLIVAIGETLPIASWGLMIIPFWDLGLTFIIRTAIYKGVRK